MRLRKLALAVGLAGMLGADVASALGLGEIKLQSNLNEPLDAEIKLLNVKDLTKEEILVGLAGKDDFQRAGVDRIFFLTGMKFEVDISSPSGPVVHVSSRKPVVEPYLNFLLETQWPSGRLLREYTLLMDLPTFSEEGMVPVQGAQTRQPEPTPSATNRRTPPPVTRQTRETSSAPQQSSRPTNTSNRDAANQRASTDREVSVYGPVSGSDTLWEIALQVRPDRAVSVQQTMLAIQRLNPGAFINDNINLLRKGQVLRIPTRNEIQSLNGRQAVAQVAQQNNEWGDSAGRTSGAALDASRRSSRRDAANTEVSGQVVLGAPEETNSSRSGRSSGSAGGNAEVLQNDLAIAQEELDRTTRENSELKDRVTSLEDQIKTMESLIEASNSELERLQALSRQANSDSVANSTRQTETPVIETSVSDSSVNTVPDVTTDTTDLAADDKAAAEADKIAAEAKQAEAVKEEKPKKPKPIVRKQPDTFMDTIMNNIAYIGGGLAALLLAGFLYWRHRKNQEEWDEDEFEPLADEGFDSDEQSGEDAGNDLDLDADEADVADDTPENADAAVGQADIFVAYRQFDKAGKVLENALMTEPTHAGALLKLLEVHAKNDDLEALEAVHGRIIDLENEELTEQANALRTSLLSADTNDFAGAEDVDLASLEADLNDFSFDSDETSGAGDSIADSELDSSLELSLDDELDNELSLDEDLILEEEVDGESNIDLSDDFASGTELTADDDNAFDFDLSEMDDVADSSSGIKPTADDSSLADIEPQPLEQDVDALDMDLSSIGDAEIDDANQETDTINLNSADDELELDLSLDEQDVESPLTEEDEFDSFDFDLGEDESENSNEDSLLGADLANDDTFTLELEDDAQANDADLTLDLSDEVDPDDGVLTLDDPSDESELSLSLDDDKLSADDDFSASDLTLDLDGDIDELSATPEGLASDGLGSDSISAENLTIGDSDSDTTTTSKLNGDEDTEQGVESFGGSFEEALGLSEPDTSEPDTLLELDASDESFASLNDADKIETSDTDTKAESIDTDSLESFAGDDNDTSVNEDLTELNEPDDLSLGDDDFDFDSETNDSVDLAALDQEMDEFDLAADLDIDDEGMPLEDADLSELDMQVDDSEPGQLASGILDSETQIHEAIADEQDAQASESNDENEVFEEALSGVPTPEEPLSFDADDVEDDELDAELDFLADTDEVATKLDLARAYIDMGDAEGAKDILDEVITEGNEEQRTEAEELVSRIG